MDGGGRGVIFSGILRGRHKCMLPYWTFSLGEETIRQDISKDKVVSFQHHSSKNENRGRLHMVTLASPSDCSEASESSESVSSGSS